MTRCRHLTYGLEADTSYMYAFLTTTNLDKPCLECVHPGEGLILRYFTYMNQSFILNNLKVNYKAFIYTTSNKSDKDTTVLLFVCYMYALWFSRDNAHLMNLNFKT